MFNFPGQRLSFNPHRPAPPEAEAGLNAGDLIVAVEG